MSLLAPSFLFSTKSPSCRIKTHFYKWISIIKPKWILSGNKKLKHTLSQIIKGLVQATLLGNIDIILGRRKKKKKIHSHHYTTLTTVSAFYRYILQRGSAPTTHILYFYYTFSHTARQMSLGMAGASNCCVILCLVIFLFSETALVSQVFVMVTNDVMNIFVHRGVLVQLCDPQWAFFFF